MSLFADALREFHNHPNGRADVATAGTALRWTLHEEEHEELMEALTCDDRAMIARELADVLYICFGTALVYGIDLDAAFKEVHRVNMVKMDAGLRREDGKIVKPPGLIPPDMTGALAVDDYRAMKLQDRYGTGL